MKKRMLSLLLALSMCFSLLVIPANAAEPAAISVTADAETLNAGDTVTVSVSLDSNPGMAFWQLKPLYNASVFEVVEIVKDGDLSPTIGTSAAWAYAANSTYTGAILKVTFKVKDDAAIGAYELGVALVEAYDEALNDVAINITNPTVTVVPKEIPVTSIVLDQTALALNVNETATLTATVSPDDASFKTVTWTSSDEAVATVSGGVVTAVGVGEATITAQAGDFTATCVVNVGDVPVTGITLNQSALDLLVNEKDTLTATVTPDNATDKTVTWTSSDEAVATVSGGVVTAVGAGEATITAQAGEFSATCVVTVEADSGVVVPVEVADMTSVGNRKYYFSITEHQGIQLNLGVTISDLKDKGTSKAVAYTSNEDGSITVTASELVKWYLDESKTVYRTSKMLLEKEIGGLKCEDSKLIQLTTGKATKQYTVYIEVVPENPITEIEVSHPNIEKNEETGALTMDMVVGVSEQIDMSFTVPYEELEPNQIVYWVSGDETVATVDQNGKVTALSAGTATIIAMAVDPSGIATIAENNGVMAQITLTVEEPAAGYTVTMSEDVEAVVGGDVSIPVTVGHTDNVTSYNAFDFTFTYDPAVLELTSTQIEGMTVTDNNGTVHVERYGTDLTVDETALTLTFKAIVNGNTNVKVTSAKVDISEAALTQDAPDASVIDNITLVSITGYTVSLPAEFTGEPTVMPGDSYTFEAIDKNYNYTFAGSTMDGEAVTVKDNKNGTFTIENVTGNIVIVTEKKGKTFNVTLGEDMTSEFSTATYMTDYVAALNKVNGYNYQISVTIGDVPYTNFEYNAETGFVTIPGEDITGWIVFNSNKTEATADIFTVEFQGNGAGDATGEKEATENESYSFTVAKVVGYAYTVTYTMGDSTESVTLTETDGQYTIEKVTGDLIISINKEYDMVVEVNEYLTLNGKTMFLVTASGTVDAGKVLSYDGTAMFYSNQYNAWSFLVITDTTLSAEDAEDLITLNEGTKVEVNQTFNVNETANDTVDINDAQLVFDMYNNEYQDFSVATMVKFLKADVNNTKKIDVNDAAAIVAQIVAAK